MSIQSLYDLTGKVALVTGAGRGMGRAMATRLGEAGAAIVATDIVLDGAQDLVHSLNEMGTEALALQVDVSSDESVATMTAEALKVYDSVDILVNNAGIMARTNILDDDLEQFGRTMEINLGGAMRCCRALAPQMRDRGWGRIINMGSSFSARGSIVNLRGGGADYCFSKGCIHNFTAVLAYELAAHGVTVNAIAPGIIDTPMHVRGSEAMREKWAPMIPAGRLGQSQDIANVAVFLASEAAAYITGQVIEVNGGLLMLGF
jgi:NAD(P)-dependent dehydrogenase (short-subunit alcohol dehydrogenase family)